MLVMVEDVGGHKGLFKRSKSEDEIRRFTPSDWSKTKMRPRRPGGHVLVVSYNLISEINATTAVRTYCQGVCKKLKFPCLSQVEKRKATQTLYTLHPTQNFNY